MHKQFILLAFLWSCGLTYAQDTDEDAWVFFNAKNNVVNAIENPISILTQRAIDRKNRHGISIDMRDVPVDEDYISEIKNTIGLTVFAKSKWFNAIHVRGNVADIYDLLDLEFVNHIDFANKALNRMSQIHPTKDKFEFEDTQVNITYGTTQNQIDMIKLNGLHSLDYTGDGIIIGVLDAGFPNVNTMGAFQYLRDAGKLLGGYDFVDRTENVYDYSGSAHGTKVLSAMAGNIENQYVGAAPDASYYVFRTEDVGSENPVEESYWVEALERADSLGVDIINSSLGYKGYDNPNYSYSAGDLNGNTTYITKGASIASEKGMLIVNSAGNSGTSGIIAPADAESVLAIGAVDIDGFYANFSSQGSAIQPTQKPDVVARGVATYVIDSNNNIVQNNGTSFSAPIMTGAIACLWLALPNLSALEIMQMVRESASKYNNPNNFLGYGIPNLQLALDTALSVPSLKNNAFRVLSNPVQNKLNFIFPNDIYHINLDVYNVLGEKVFTALVNKNETVDLDYLASGVYLVKLSSLQFKSQIIKLIKE